MPTPPRRTWLAVAVPLVLVFAVIVGSLRISLPYYALAPGSARPVDPLIDAPEGQRFPSDGDVLLTTISLYQVSPIDALIGWVRDDIDVVPEDRVLPPDTTDAEYRRYNFEVMDESKQTAIVVALRRLGYEVAEQGKGALIERVVPGFPADGRLRPGEVITAVDGQPVTLVQQATGRIGAHQVGEAVRLDVQQPDGSDRRTVEVTLAPDPEQGGKAVLGVLLRTHERTFDLPFPVDIDSKNIGGPSAGLAFTLAVLDELRPGELTGGHKVAATGTIEIDGRVGDVGGVAQKTAAVKKAGAELFLVPAGEYEIAKAHAGRGLRVVKVATLQDALDALASIGGDLASLTAPAAGTGR